MGAVAVEFFFLAPIVCGLECVGGGGSSGSSGGGGALSGIPSAARVENDRLLFWQQLVRIELLHFPATSELFH